MNLSQIAEGRGLTYAAIDEDTIQIAMCPVTKTDLPTGWVGRCGIRRLTPGEDLWCLIFEVAACSAPTTELELYNSPNVQYLQKISRFCVDHFGFMEVVNANGGNELSRINWSIDSVTQFEITKRTTILALGGSVSFNLPPELIFANVIPIIFDLIHQINITVI